MEFRNHTDQLPTQSLTTDALLAANLQVLQQGLALLTQLDDERYTATAAPFLA